MCAQEKSNPHISAIKLSEVAFPVKKQPKKFKNCFQKKATNKLSKLGIYQLLKI